MVRKPPEKLFADDIRKAITATQAGAANFLLCHRRFPLLKK